jgi:predicted ester cyclase
MQAGIGRLYASPAWSAIRQLDPTSYFLGQLPCGPSFGNVRGPLHHSGDQNQWQRCSIVVPRFEKMTELTMQAEEDSKAVVREYVEAFNRGDLQRLKELLAHDAEIQGVKGKGTFEKVAPVWRQLIDGYGVQLKIEGLIAEGNTVAARYLESGTFRAPAFGNQPTGRSYELVAMEWFEIESGRIKRRWGARDAAAQARQLGIAPA